MGNGCISEGYLKWGGGGGVEESSRDLSKDILKQEVGKGRSCSYGEGGFEGAPRKILIIHLLVLFKV